LFLFFTLSVNARGKAEAPGDISTVEKDVKRILKIASPSIVKVVSRNHKIHFATGIAIDRNHIISNLIVVRYPYDSIYIKTVDGKKFPAKVVGKDKGSSIILLRIDKNTLTPIKRAATCEVGDWTALVGAFYNQFPAIFQGIVSSVSDEILILNAPVAPGASGGAVVNKKGELMGVIRGSFGYASSPDYTYKDHSGEFHILSTRSKSKDLCIAVPVGKVVSIAHDLKKYGKVKRGWLGVNITSSKHGVNVTYVVSNSPAKKAGIRKGDLILRVNGKPIKEAGDLSGMIQSFKPEQKVKLEYLRGKGKESALVILGELKDKKKYDFPFSPDSGVIIPELPESLPNIENYVFRFASSRVLGVEITTLTPELAKEFKVKEGTGLMISKVYKDTAAEKAGFRAADIIVKAGNKTIEKNADLRRALSSLKDNEPIVINVYRKGALKKIKVVPDKNKIYGVTLERLQDKLKDIKIRIDAERLEAIEVRQLRKEKEYLRKIQEKYAKEKAKELKKYKIETEKQLRKEREYLRKIQEKYAKEVQLIKKNEIEKYKEAVEKMREEQEKMKKEMEKMKEMLEKEKEKEEKKKTSKT